MNRRSPYNRSPYHRSPYRRSPYNRSPYNRSPYHRSPYRRSPYHRSLVLGGASKSGMINPKSEYEGITNPVTKHEIPNSERHCIGKQCHTFSSIRDTMKKYVDDDGGIINLIKMISKEDSRSEFEADVLLNVKNLMPIMDKDGLLLKFFNNNQSYNETDYILAYKRWNANNHQNGGAGDLNWPHVTPPPPYYGDMIVIVLLLMPWLITRGWDACATTREIQPMNEFEQIQEEPERHH